MQCSSGFVFVCLLLGAGLAADAATNPVPPPAGERTALAQEVPKWLADADVPSVAVATIERGAVAWRGVWGDARPGVAATPATRYNVASLTKPVTAEVVLRLVSQGRLDLDADMAEHYVDADLATDPRVHELTPRIALTHQTGFPNWRAQTPDGRLAFRFDPGTDTAYSGEGYEYLARYTERKVREPFDALARALLFEPLGLAATTFAGDASLRDLIAMPQGADGTRREPDVPVRWRAADDLSTTVNDYATFVAAVMRADGVSPSLHRDRLQVPRVRFADGECPWGPSACPRSLGFAMGWAVFEFDEQRVVLQGGADWGERTLAFFVPERGFGLVVFTNGANGGKVIHKVVEALYPHPGLLAFLAFQAH